MGHPEANVGHSKGNEPPSSTCGSGGLLDYPHYTRPAEFRGMPVPEVLMNGNHDEIRRWRRRQALQKTLANRPDLLRGAELSKEDRKILEEIEGSHPYRQSNGDKDGAPKVVPAATKDPLKPKRGLN